MIQYPEKNENSPRTDRGPFGGTAYPNREGKWHLAAGSSDRDLTPKRGDSLWLSPLFERVTGIEPLLGRRWRHSVARCHQSRRLAGLHIRIGKGSGILRRVLLTVISLQKEGTACGYPLFMERVTGIEPLLGLLWRHSVARCHPSRRLAGLHIRIGKGSGILRRVLLTVISLQKEGTACGYPLFL